MQITTDRLKNKQRIYIGGTKYVDEIFDLVRSVLDDIGKPADFYTVGKDTQLTDAPVVFIKGGDSLANGKTPFLGLDIHMLLLHQLDSDIPEGYASFDEFVLTYEKLADQLPKAGTLIYSEENDVTTMIGKKEREDVKAIEYSSLSGDNVPEGNFDTDFLSYAAAAKTLLKRIGVSKNQFYTALKSLA